ncbi:hypothetical protein BUY89_12650, partial [Staphylococcus equorum]
PSIPPSKKPLIAIKIIEGTLKKNPPNMIIKSIFKLCKKILNQPFKFLLKLISPILKFKIKDNNNTNNIQMEYTDMDNNNGYLMYNQ